MFIAKNTKKCAWCGKQFTQAARIINTAVNTAREKVEEKKAEIVE